LSDAEITQVENYAIAKYNLGSYGTLPVTGAALWLDASRMDTLFTDNALTTAATTDNGPVGGWKDLSGNNRHALQTTSSARPTWRTPINGQNGLGVLSFDVTSVKNLTYPAQTSPNQTVFIVHRGLASSLTDTRLFTTNGAYRVSLGSTSATLSFVREFTAWTNSGFSKIYNTSLFNLTYTSSPSFLASVARNESSGSSTIQSLNAVGGGSSSAEYISQPGNYCEIVLFPRLLSTAETDAMNTYLRAKWGTP
jgi:hypothetical protein